MNQKNFISIPLGMGCKIRLVIHEQNTVAVLTNRLLARLARVVRQVFPGSFYRQHKHLVSARVDQ
jgi:UDP-N-acetylglucosamine:LPS N-acetylglucosamine transferase